MVIWREIWRPVAGWPGYQVSDLGRVRGLRGWVLKDRRHTNGYLRVSLCKDGKRTDAYVHRLVCGAFHGPCPAGHECDHRNKVRSDNRLENLRWILPEANKAQRDFARGEKNGAAKLTADAVARVRAMLPYRSNAEVAAAVGVARRTIADIRNGRTWI
jgi:hypothetical protein